MNLTITVIDPPDFGIGEPTPGPWLHLISDEPFCDYVVCTTERDCRCALARKIHELCGLDEPDCECEE